LKLLKLFYVPAFVFQFYAHKKYEFTSDVEPQDNRPHGWTIPLNTTFPNIPDDDVIVSAEQRDSLKKDLQFQMMKLFRMHNLPDKFTYKDFWYNIYHENQGQEQHTHLRGTTGICPYWSGIYYYRGISQTLFHRPDVLNRVHRLPLRDSSELFEYNSDYYKPTLGPGDVILFPPYVQHSVESLPSDKMRMTFSFNIELHHE
tara:strand:- start:97 stop:699 length:603 start_codon:yes stop_codon:yes gene_type:complete